MTAAKAAGGVGASVLIESCESYGSGWDRMAVVEEVAIAAPPRGGRPPALEICSEACQLNMFESHPMLLSETIV
jgi:hypothetical protein